MYFALLWLFKKHPAIIKISGYLPPSDSMYYISYINITYFSKFWFYFKNHKIRLGKKCFENIRHFTRILQQFCQNLVVKDFQCEKLWNLSKSCTWYVQEKHRRNQLPAWASSRDGIKKIRAVKIYQAQLQWVPKTACSKLELTAPFYQIKSSLQKLPQYLLILPIWYHYYRILMASLRNLNELMDEKKKYHLN